MDNLPTPDHHPAPSREDTVTAWLLIALDYDLEAAVELFSTS